MRERIYPRGQLCRLVIRGINAVLSRLRPSQSVVTRPVLALLQWFVVNKLTVKRGRNKGRMAWVGQRWIWLASVLRLPILMSLSLARPHSLDKVDSICLRE
jgi:hypothetical protein